MTKVNLKPFQDILALPQQVEELQNTVNALSERLSKMNSISSKGWVCIEFAAKEIGKSKPALYQRLKHKNKPMPEGIVWKQDGGPGTAMLIDVQQYFKHI